MTDIITTTVKPAEPSTVIDPALQAAISQADPQALVAGILQAGARLADEDVDGLEKLAMTAQKVVRGDALPALLAVAHQIDPHTHVITEGHAIWTMRWDGLNPDGTRRHPDKPDSEEIFEDARGLALLLANEVVHLNTNHWRSDWPRDARETVYLGVDCSDVFAWGCSDSESAVHKDIEDVYRHWLKDPRWGPAVWCMIRRGQMPQRPVEKRIREAGIWDLDALKTAHGLRANHYDGISGVQAGQKYEAYCAWERSQGNEPMPFDARWWEGWRRFTDANPEWQDAAWKAEDERRRNAWREENGYGDPKVDRAETEDDDEIDVPAEIARLTNMVEASGEWRRTAASSEDGFSRSYLLQSAAASEREVLSALPALLAAVTAREAAAADRELMNRVLAGLKLDGSDNRDAEREE